MIDKKLKINRGFTLVETLFAVFILTFVIVGLMTVVSSSLFAARYARDETTANYLLQEAVDYIRNDRDAIVFSSDPDGWNTFSNKYQHCIGVDGCYFDVLNMINNPGSTIESCQNDGCPYLYYDDGADSTAFYVSDDRVNTDKVISKFKRTITITKPNPYEYIITVTVTWKNGSINQERVLRTSLTNWQIAI